MEAEHLVIDGSQGEGGGQVVRSSLALAMLTGQSVTIDNIRAGRKKPGLLQQHLTSVRAARDVCGAVVEGDELRSSRLVFEPGPVYGGNYSFRINTAGSTTLVLQTVLPALMIADEPSTVRIEGGTHNPMAPPVDFLRKAFLPLLSRMGPKVDLELERYGFYPAGGGRIRATIQPSHSLSRLQLVEGGRVSKGRSHAIVAKLPKDIGERECKTIQRKLNWTAANYSVDVVHESSSTGNIVFAEVERGGVMEVVTGFGERGVPAEKVASSVAREVKRYIKADVPVGEHLADQLLLPMGIGAHFGTGGGQFRTLEPSGHTTTHIEILQKFLDVTITTEKLAADDYLITVEPKN